MPTPSRRGRAGDRPARAQHAGAPRPAAVGRDKARRPTPRRPVNNDLMSNGLNFYALVSGPVPSPFEEDDEYSPTKGSRARLVCPG